MARGDMGFDTLAVNLDAEILNRKEFEAIPNTIDFSDVEAGDDGVKVVKAGTPIANDGTIVTESPWTNAVGIALHDVYESRPQVAVLKKGYVNILRAQANCGLTYDSALVNALMLAGCQIVFEAGADGAVILGSLGAV